MPMTLGMAIFFFAEEPEAEQANAKARPADALCKVGTPAQGNEDRKDHAHADGLDRPHDIKHDLALPEFLEEEGRHKGQRQGGGQHTNDGYRTAQHSGGLGAGKGGAVDAQGTGGHLRNGHDIGHIVGCHPVVREHFFHDQGDHRGAAKAGKTNFGKGEEELEQCFNHALSPPSRQGPARHR